jgi:hypothetical protein
LNSNHQFLQNLETIEFFVWSDKATAPTLVFKSQIHGEHRTQRGAPQRWLKSELEKWGSATGKDWKAEKSALQQTLTTANASQAPRHTLCLNLDITTQGQQRRQAWWVRQGIGQQESLQLALQKDMAELTVWPLAGVAALLSEQGQDVPFEGLAFASVPTNIKTGLPVHVNGCFLLSDNRRSLASGDSNKRLKTWNRAVITDAIATLYSELLVELRRAPLSVPKFYAYWPIEGSNEEWSAISPAVYQLLKGENVLCVRSSSFNFCSRLPQPQFASSGTGLEWRSCRDCFWDSTVRLPARGGREWAHWMWLLAEEYARAIVGTGTNVQETQRPEGVLGRAFGAAGRGVSSGSKVRIHEITAARMH